jgi:hypothetical protein
MIWLEMVDLYPSASASASASASVKFPLFHYQQRRPFLFHTLFIVQIGGANPKSQRWSAAQPPPHCWQRSPESFLLLTVYMLTR